MIGKVEMRGELLKMHTCYNEYMHFTINGVIDCFEWIYQNEPDSIFRERMLMQLKKWHEKYRLSFDLYVYERKNGFLLEKLQNKYWMEINDNSEWLKLGWYQVCKNSEMDSDYYNYLSIKRVYSLIENRASINVFSKTVRAKITTLSKRMAHEFESVGVTCLLCWESDKGKIYDLNNDEIQIINKKSGYKRTPTGFYYKKTDIVFDNTNYIDQLVALTEEYDKFANRKCLEVCVDEALFETSRESIGQVLNSFD